MTPANPRILVVDDEPSVSTLCEYVLRDAQYEVDIATTAAKAIELMRAHPYDAMLIDLVMPQGGGIETIKSARQLHPSTPVIVMTAEPQHLVPPMGTDLYIHKPFSSLSALEKVVRKALVRGHANASRAG